jgi:hypothetical protein
MNLERKMLPVIKIYFSLALPLRAPEPDSFVVPFLGMGAMDEEKLVT